MAQDLNSQDTAASRRVLIVDDDEMARILASNYLGRLGYAQVTAVADGEAAWEQVQTSSFDLIILDWQLPRISGLALFNRFRSHAKAKNIPLLVMSGLLKQQDFRLLQEFPCTTLVEKPFTFNLFQTRIEELLRESVWHQQNTALIDALLAAVEGDVAKAEPLVKKLLKEAPNPVPLALLTARRLVRARMLKLAKTLLESVLRLDESSVVAMTELGKVLHLQGHYTEALDVLRPASRLSPQNLQRLCLIGEAELQINDIPSAKVRFDQVLAADPEHPKARAGALLTENLLSAGPNGGLVETASRGFASLANMRGIAMVRSGQIAKGLEHYQASLVFLRNRDDSARVAFNLGLGYLRWGKRDAAKHWFGKSEAFNSENFDRARHYSRLLSLRPKAPPELEVVSEAVIGADEANVAASDKAASKGDGTPAAAAMDTGAALAADIDKLDVVGAAPDNDDGGTVLAFPAQTEFLQAISGGASENGAAGGGSKGGGASDGGKGKGSKGGKAKARA